MTFPFDRIKNACQHVYVCVCVCVCEYNIYYITRTAAVYYIIMINIIFIIMWTMRNWVKYYDYYWYREENIYNIVYITPTLMSRRHPVMFGRRSTFYWWIVHNIYNNCMKLFLDGCSRRRSDLKIKNKNARISVRTTLRIYII